VSEDSSSASSTLRRNPDAQQSAPVAT
jgi:hypothetical protein